MDEPDANIGFREPTAYANKPQRGKEVLGYVEKHMNEPGGPASRGASKAMW